MLPCHSKSRRLSHISGQLALVLDRSYDPHSHSVEAHELRRDTTSSCEACHFLLLQGSRVSGARGIKAETYTEELAKKTEGYGDCCMMSICEWGRARLEFEEDINNFDDQDHTHHVGEFTF